MKILSKPIKLKKLKEIAENKFGDMVKAVVDIEKGIMAINGELHADEEALLLNKGSNQKNLWGINLYPEFYNTDNFVEFDSMINLRPSQGNPDRGVCDPKAREKILKIAKKLIKNE